MNSAKQSIFHVKKKLRSHQKQPAQHGRLHSTVLTKLIDQLFRHNVLYLSSLLSSSWFTSPVGHRHHSWDLMRFREIMMWLVLELGRSGFIVHLRSMSIKMLVIRIFFLSRYIFYCTLWLHLFCRNYWMKQWCKNLNLYFPPQFIWQKIGFSSLY